jgi:hypothetical protein
VIKFKEELLHQIAAGLHEHHPVRLGSIEVVFETPSAQYTFGLAEALDALALDLYWDERGDWSEARTARVRTL